MPTLTDKTLDTLRTVIARSAKKPGQAAQGTTAISAVATAVLSLRITILNRLRRWIRTHLPVNSRRAGRRAPAPGGAELIRRDRVLAAVARSPTQPTGWWSCWCTPESQRGAGPLPLHPGLGRTPQPLPAGRDPPTWAAASAGCSLLIAGLMFIIAHAAWSASQTPLRSRRRRPNGIGWLDRDTVEPTRKIANI